MAVCHWQLLGKATAHLAARVVCTQGDWQFEKRLCTQTWAAKSFDNFSIYFELIKMCASEQKKPTLCVRDLNRSTLGCQYTTRTFSSREAWNIKKKSKFEIIGGLSVRQLRNNVWSNYKTNNFTHLLELNQNFRLITKCDISVLVCLLATCEMVIFTSIFSPVFGCYISRTSFNFSAVRCHPWQPADWRCSSSYFPLTPRITFQAETFFYALQHLPHTSPNYVVIAFSSSTKFSIRF